MIGSAGPTTAGRLDAYTPRLVELGLKGMIGKGERNAAVKESLKTHKAVYFAAIGYVLIRLLFGGSPDPSGPSSPP